MLSASPTSIDIQINGVTYDVNLNNYAQFYLDLANNTIDTLAKYVNKINNASEEIEYVKFYPSQFYEYDSRGFITINVPFNGKVVATVKYKEDNTLTETTFAHNNYLGTPVLLTNSMASVTNVIERSVWGDIIANNINSNNQINTSFGLTGHKWDYQSELTYLHARYMLNQNKTFLSQDPISIVGFDNEKFLIDPQGQNSYSYARLNPVSNIDPDGKYWVIGVTLHAPGLGGSMGVKIDFKGVDAFYSGGAAVGAEAGVYIGYAPLQSLSHERTIQDTVNVGGKFGIGTDLSQVVQEVDSSTGRYSESNESNLTFSAGLQAGASGSFEREYNKPLIVWSKPNEKIKTPKTSANSRNTLELNNQPFPVLQSSQSTQASFKNGSDNKTLLLPANSQRNQSSTNKSQLNQAVFTGARSVNFILR